MPDQHIRLGKRTAIVLDFAQAALKGLCPVKWAAAHAEARANVADLCQAAGVPLAADWQWRVKRNFLTIF